jgi:hypothetical protein
MKNLRKQMGNGDKDYLTKPILTIDILNYNNDFINKIKTKNSE